MTKRLAFLSLPLLAAVCACSPEAQNQSAQAADTIASDANATAADAVRDTDAALGAAETRMDNVGDVLANKADRAAHQTGEALKTAGNEIEN